MEEKQINLKKSFFEKTKISILNIERYPELVAEKVPRAINYLAKLVAILAIVICIGMIYKTTQIVNQVIDYIEKEFPDFSYQEGILDVNSENPITIENDTIGTILIDTKAESEETINQYTNQMAEKEKSIFENAVEQIEREHLDQNNSIVVGGENWHYGVIRNSII